MKSILIVRLSSLGDIIHTVPAFACLREAFPEAEIGWVVSGRGRAILEMLKGLNRIITSPFETRDFKSIYGFEAAVDFQGLIKSAFVTFFSGARHRYGFSRKLCREGMASLFYNHRLENFNGRHVIDKNLALARFVSGRDCRLWKFPFKLEVYPELHNLFKGKIILNVGASWRTKRLSPEKVADVATQLRELGLQPVLLWGTEEERREAERAAQLSGAELAPFLDIKQVFYAVKVSKGVISPDSFVLHVATALHKPAVGIFGPTDPFRNGPLSHHSAFVYTAEPCSPCWKRSCKNPICMEKITADDVIDAVVRTFLM